MASPPFQVEDQTDEDFFDKLVDDEFEISKPPDGVPADFGESDETRAFANMSVADSGACADSEDTRGGELNSKGEDQVRSVATVEVPAKDILVSEESVSLISSSSFSFNAVIESKNPALGAETVSESVAAKNSGSFSFDAETELEDSDSVPPRDALLEPVMVKSSGSGATGVKEVQWSAFAANSSDQKSSGGFGSYSDFFAELPDGSKDPFAEIGDKSITDPLQTSRFVANQVENSSADLISSNEDQAKQSYRGLSEQTSSEQDLSNSQYWENQYPGWRYDPSSGQWYQIDGYDVSANNDVGVQDNGQLVSDNTVASQVSEVSYLQQTAQSVTGTVADVVMTTSVANSNQALQENQQYPAHMYFDPQYPGWYYDMISQEWRSLESYNETAEAQSAVSEQQTQDLNTSLSGGPISGNDYSFYNGFNQVEQYSLQGQQGEVQGGGYWTGSTSGYSTSNTWQSKQVVQSGALTGFSSGQQTENYYASTGAVKKNFDQNMGFKNQQSDSTNEKPYHGYNINNGSGGFHSFTSTENSFAVNQHRIDQSHQTNFSFDNNESQKSLSYSQQLFQTGNAAYTDFSYTSNQERSAAGRPPHALVTFGFGGKLIVMKDSSSSFGTKESVGGSISILNLVEVVEDKNDASSFESGACDYFHALCQQSFPGPLVGGNAGSKEVTKWIDERIANYQSPNFDFRKGELLRLLLSLLKILCQHYGKIRSPFSIDPATQENGPESAVAQLFASAKRNGNQMNSYAAISQCVQNLPTEGQIQRTAIEVQNLLVSGKRKEALECAQDGQLWGAALVLAAQLGDKFYVDTVKQMAQRQFVSGTPLRTLCLLIAGQPADVFSADSSVYPSAYGMANMSPPHPQVTASGMLDDWEENLAIISANRTKDDELVIIHLGDTLWKERGEVVAPHICYLVAEANFESYSDSARLCLLGGDHLKYPRTYVSPDAIERTEVYEYSKVFGNSQFVLLPFQPYKIIYAHMLAEVGKLAESLRYCQAVSKTLKNAGRAPEVEAWKSLCSSLEERIKTHQQGGYGTNLAPAKLVGKLFTSIDRSIHRMIGSAPTPTLSLQQNMFHGSELDAHSLPPKVATSHSTMALSTLMTSTEQTSEWSGDGNRMMPNRSVSEPNFGRNKQQDQFETSNNAPATNAQGKASAAGPSRFGRLGSQILQKTIGWVSRSRPDRQAKLGEANKFYYDEKLKRWVEEGAEPPAEEAALPPPPTTASFQNGMMDYNASSAFKSLTLPANGGSEAKTPALGSAPAPTCLEQMSGTPPLPHSTNQFSGRGRMGVRSRYVDTFNKGGGTPTSLFQAPSAPTAKPMGGAKFFVPSPVIASIDQTRDTTEENMQEVTSTEDASTSAAKDSSFSSLSSESSSAIPRFSSADNIAPLGNKGMVGLQNGEGPYSRASSWSGSYNNPLNPNTAEVKNLGETLGMQIPSMSSSPPLVGPINISMSMSSGSFGDQLQEVEL